MSSDRSNLAGSKQAVEVKFKVVLVFFLLHDQIGIGLSDTLQSLVFKKINRNGVLPVNEFVNLALHTGCGNLLPRP